MKKKKQQKQPVFKKMNSNAAGIDIGSKSHYVAVPPGRDQEDDKDVRCFGTFTFDLYGIYIFAVSYRLSVGLDF